MEKPALMDQNATPFLVQLIIFSFPCHFSMPFLGVQTKSLRKCAIMAETRKPHEALAT